MFLHRKVLFQMIIFGLTGGIACGKSTVTKTFQAHDIPMIDADVVARQVVEPGTVGLSSIVATFGQDILQKDGTLDRGKLGKLAFSNAEAMAKLNHIMAPLIDEETNKQIRMLRLAGHKLIGYDAALICEMGNADRYRPLIVVYCPRDTQIERLMKRNNLTREEAVARVEAQMPVEQKAHMADHLIYTWGTIEESRIQTEMLIEILKRNGSQLC